MNLRLTSFFCYPFFHFRITVDITLNGRNQNINMPLYLYDMINDPKCGKVLKSNEFIHIYINPLPIIM